MKISKVKLRNLGMGGLEVWYENTVSRDGREFIDEVHKKKSMPVGPVVMNLFHDLEGVFRDLKGIEGKDVSVYQVKAGADRFLLSAHVNSGVMNKYTADSTPLIMEDDDYAGYVGVMEIVDQIWSAVAKYMEGNDVRSDRQLVMDFNSAQVLKGKAEPIMLEDLEGMSEEEVKKFATDVLEKMGSCVMHRDE